MQCSNIVPALKFVVINWLIAIRIRLEKLKILLINEKEILKIELKTPVPP